MKCPARQDKRPFVCSRLSVVADIIISGNILLTRQTANKDICYEIRL